LTLPDKCRYFKEESKGAGSMEHVVSAHGNVAATACMGGARRIWFVHFAVEVGEENEDFNGTILL